MRHSAARLCRWLGCWSSTSRATVFRKRLGWREFEFRFTELESRDEMTELQIQMELLKAGVLTVGEVRALRGLGARAGVRSRRWQRRSRRKMQEGGDNE